MLSEECQVSKVEVLTFRNIDTELRTRRCEGRNRNKCHKVMPKLLILLHLYP